VVVVVLVVVFAAALVTVETEAAAIILLAVIFSLILFAVFQIDTVFGYCDNFEVSIFYTLSTFSFVCCCRCTWCCIKCLPHCSYKGNTRNEKELYMRSAVCEYLIVADTENHL
jgi:hypothetical protein